MFVCLFVLCVFVYVCVLFCVFLCILFVCLSFFGWGGGLNMCDVYVCICMHVHAPNIHTTGTRTARTPKRWAALTKEGWAVTGMTISRGSGASGCSFWCLSLCVCVVCFYGGLGVCIYLYLYLCVYICIHIHVLGGCCMWVGERIAQGSQKAQKKSDTQSVHRMCRHTHIYKHTHMQIYIHVNITTRTLTGTS